MIIYTDYNKPYVIDSLRAPVVPEYFWTFSGTLLDFTLTPIAYLEQSTGPTLTIEIDGVQVQVPMMWHILVTDDYMHSLDTVPIANCIKNNYNAVLFSPNGTKPSVHKIKIADYDDNVSLHHPMIQKGNMLCYPVGQSKPTANNEEDLLCVSVGPYDLYAKYFTNVKDDSGRVLEEVGLQDIVY